MSYLKNNSIKNEVIEELQEIFKIKMRVNTNKKGHYYSLKTITTDEDRIRLFLFKEIMKTYCKINRLNERINQLNDRIKILNLIMKDKFNNKRSDEK